MTPGNKQKYLISMSWYEGEIQNVIVEAEYSNSLITYYCTVILICDTFFCICHSENFLILYSVHVHRHHNFDIRLLNDLYSVRGKWTKPRGQNPRSQRKIWLPGQNQFMGGKRPHIYNPGDGISVLFLTK